MGRHSQPCQGDILRRDFERRCPSGYQGFIDRVLCAGTPPISSGDIKLPEACGPAPNPRTLTTQSQQHPLFGMTAYELLKTATEVFLMLYCGVVIRDKDVLGNLDVLGKPIFSKDEELARSGLTNNIDFVNLLVAYLGPGRLPYIQRVVQTAFPDEVLIDSVFCTGILRSKVDCPCLIELIWSYWHEEGMLVQTLNAISRRFQNVRARRAIAIRSRISRSTRCGRSTTSSGVTFRTNTTG